MTGPAIEFSGVTFDSVRGALTDLYFRHKSMTQEEFSAAAQYVVPMQHNFTNPIEPGGQDTWIQYWIDSDERLVHDRNEEGNFNAVQKLARVTVRFLGARAEVWAKAFHHLHKRKHTAQIFVAYCNASLLPYVGPIVASNVDYFGVANTTKAFTIHFSLRYDEVLDYSDGSGADGLEYISFAVGSLTNTAPILGGGQ